MEDHLFRITSYNHPSENFKLDWKAMANVSGHRSAAFKGLMADIQYVFCRLCSQSMCQLTFCSNRAWTQREREHLEFRQSNYTFPPAIKGQLLKKQGSNQHGSKADSCKKWKLRDLMERNRPSHLPGSQSQFSHL